MLGEFTLPAWTLGVFILGLFFGWAFGRASVDSDDDEDDGPGAVGADELEQ